MAFGDVLKSNISRLSNASENKCAVDAFWIILRDIAVKEIIAMYPSKVDSNIAVEVYYDILCDNAYNIPIFLEKGFILISKKDLELLIGICGLATLFIPMG